MKNKLSIFWIICKVLLITINSTTLFAEEMHTLETDFKIGEKGPGGGIIFFAENNTYMEYIVKTGRFRWNEAMAEAKNYRGGGFTDWRLPTREEQLLLFRSVRENRLEIIPYEIFWSSSEISNNTAWYRNFSGGRQGSAGKTSFFRILFIRDF